MNRPNLSRSSSESLARLLDPETARRAGWRPDELGAILRHQLAAPLTADIEAGGARQTFGELFRDPQPSVELLERAKQFGKKLRRDPDSPLPAEVATVIYYASIVAAKMRCGQSISDLDEAALRRGVRWALAQPWLDDTMRSLFQGWPG